MHKVFSGPPEAVFIAAMTPETRADTLQYAMSPSACCRAGQPPRSDVGAVRRADVVGHCRLGGLAVPAKHETRRVHVVGQVAADLRRRVGETIGKGGVGDRPEDGGADRAAE